ncbi:PREDICTED: uncharacterized protein LOC107192369, partial [Dufourea novaeangliae]|uniref:uncharacterized protein LOC107192369 n=1 Tax=Dufourea novaeangliae TaxID=178035 RepID=UPI000766E9FF
MCVSEKVEKESQRVRARHAKCDESGQQQNFQFQYHGRRAPVRLTTGKMDMMNPGWFSEISDLWPGVSLSLEVVKILHRERSPYQDVMVLETRSHGRALILDGIIQCTEKDEFSYQEAIAFLPLCSHPNPKTVLIVGGGDGGVAREVAKHPDVERIVQVEIDAKVLEVSRKYLPVMGAGLDHPKVTLNVGDGFEFLKQHKGEFDVIITDSSDPVVAKEYNLKRHYDTNHKTNYDQYVAKLREDKLSELKSILQKQQSVFTKCVEDNTAAVKVSYILSHLIASRSKSFTEGEFITSRIDEIAENLRNQHNSTISTFQAYSIAIDESTDIRNIAQLAVFIRGCDVNLKISEELLEIIPMHNTTTGADIFDALMEVLKKYKLPLEKFVCLATDGAPTMTSITKGVVARLKETCKQH